MSEINFGKTSEIEDGKVTVKRFGRTRVAVCKYKDNFYSFKDVCTHDNAPLDQGEICENVIQCPRHGAKFDITNGAVISAPAFAPLETYKVTLDNENIKIELD
ncbi:MAG: Rieske 2Fe-2S domain-containing protein [Candidatus Sericytochromatia bacterium]